MMNLAIAHCLALPVANSSTGRSDGGGRRETGLETSLAAQPQVTSLCRSLTAVKGGTGAP